MAIGHDEEVGGTYGASEIVEHLQSKNVKLEFVLDEGGVVIEDGMPPLTSTPVAIVGTAEKVKLTNHFLSVFDSCKTRVETYYCPMSGGAGPAAPNASQHEGTLPRFCCRRQDSESCAAPQDYSVIQVKAATPGGHAAMPPVDGSSVSGQTLSWSCCCALLGAAVTRSINATKQLKL